MHVLAGIVGMLPAAALAGVTPSASPSAAEPAEPLVTAEPAAPPSAEPTEPLVTAEPAAPPSAEPTEPLVTAEPAAPPSAEPTATPRRVRDGRHSLEVSYYGLNFLRPGAQVGYSFRALQSRRKLHALVVGADVGGYYWARHSIGVQVVPRVGWRGRHPKHGLQGEANLHLGYLQGVLPSEAFEVVNGQVQPSGRAGYPYMVVGPTLGIGYFIESIGVTPFLRTGAHWQYPIFDQAVARFNVALGVEVRL